MKIAVIDEGVLPVFNKELNIIEDLMVSSENLVINSSDDVLISTDHGFNVCKIINKYAPEAEIISIRISNSTEVNANIRALITAFKYCLDNNISKCHNIITYLSRTLTYSQATHLYFSILYF